MTGKERINQRFAKDFNLPINIFNNEMFEYYHKKYSDFWPEEEWQSLQKEIREEYYGNMDLWLEHYAEVRDMIIKELENSSEYKAFNSENMSKYEIEPMFRNISDRNIYNAESDGKMFVSIDLRKANFQALKHVGVVKEDTYEDFIDKYDKSFYFKKSKYTRQVIFGKLNPKRQITVEHYLMSQILHIGFKAIDDEYGKLIAFKSDELIWEVQGIVKDNDLCDIEQIIKERIGIDVKAECFIISKLPIINANGNEISAYVRKNLNTNESILKSTSAIYFPQVYSIWKNGEVTEVEDLYFWYEDQMAVFQESLKLIKKIV